MIEVKNLTKKYGAQTAVDDISFVIRPGMIYGLLGPNGAGKSTTMNIMAGCLSATSGSVTVNGNDIIDNAIEAKRQIGYLPELPPLYNDMTPAEYLTFVAEAKGVSYDKVSAQVAQALERTSLTSVRNKLCKNLSKGYKQRVGIAQAMLGNPDIIILDEPTVGLDPVQIIEIRELIRELGKTKTIIISSHILSEISQLCDHVIIISKGKIVADDDIENLTKYVNFKPTVKMEIKGDKDTVEGVLSGISGIEKFEISDSGTEGQLSITLTPADGADPREDIFFAMASARCVVISNELVEESLEDIFISLTSDNGGDAQ